MQSALLASTPHMAAALRRVLLGLHSQKTCSGIDSLLARLYGPILFRACSAANGQVRCNAIGLLVDAFPLTDPEVGSRS